MLALDLIPISTCFFPGLINSSLKCFAHTTEFEVGFQLDRLTNFIHLFNNSGLFYRKENKDTLVFFTNLET